MSLQRNIRMVILDNEPHQVEILEEAYRDVISRLGYGAFITSCGDRKAFTPLLKDHPQIAVCDVNLGIENHLTYQGLEIIAEQKKRYPDIIFIANTEFSIETDQFGVKFPNADVF